ncbi:MAG: PQQ-dependent sugar dehydrogenase [Gammaproteobacteria bacterium]|nr:PQQ-dependent sugar dehydrogenase [Gammaproteobacteria bacterium]MDD9897013.1 PQQ-dependent sugar dehydrogenase [Gammaproteobacteria bacterium]MDD9957805.1 PQQ-dependent sugar dehydrogenase [Gammaproteobacteria bacterium]
MLLHQYSVTTAVTFFSITASLKSLLFLLLMIPVFVVAQPAIDTDLIPRYSRPTIDDLPMILDTDEYEILVEVVASGLENPWGMAFLPDGDMLITERDGHVRLLRDGVLEPDPIPGTPEVHTMQLSGLMDIALHPEYEKNGLIYLTYNKPLGEREETIALARGRFDGNGFQDMRDIFVSTPNHAGGSRIVFAPDGSLFMTVGGAYTVGRTAERAQDGSWHSGKVLHLLDDGSPFPGNPFSGQAGYHAEVYSMGHRNQHGLAFYPLTGELWAHEHAPQGGDELNIIKPGANYGWPIVSYSRRYDGPRITQQPWQEEFEQPVVLWLPSIAPSGLMFYTGEKFPAWKNHAFVGSMRVGRILRTGHLERIVLNENGEETAREWILEELGERIRDVKQGPDELIYVLTETADGMLLRLSPVAPVEE